MPSPYVPISQAGIAGTAVIAAGVAGNRIRVLGFFGSMTATGTAQFKSSTGVVLSGAMTFAGGQPVALGPAPIENGEGILETTVAGEGLNLVTTTSGFNGVAQVQYIPG